MVRNWIEIVSIVLRTRKWAGEDLRNTENYNEMLRDNLSFWRYLTFLCISVLFLAAMPETDLTSTYIVLSSVEKNKAWVLRAKVEVTYVQKEKQRTPYRPSRNTINDGGSSRLNFIILRIMKHIWQVYLIKLDLFSLFLSFFFIVWLRFHTVINAFMTSKNFETSASLLLSVDLHLLVNLRTALVSYLFLGKPYSFWLITSYLWIFSGVYKTLVCRQ